MLVKIFHDSGENLVVFLQDLKRIVKIFHDPGENLVVFLQDLND